MVCLSTFTTIVELVEFVTVVWILRQFLDALVDRIKRLLDSSNQEPVLLLVLGHNQIVLAKVFVAAAFRMALVERKYFVD